VAAALLNVRRSSRRSVTRPIAATIASCKHVVNDHDDEIASHSECYLAQGAADTVRDSHFHEMAEKSIVGVVDQFSHRQLISRAETRTDSSANDCFETISVGYSAKATRHWQHKQAWR